MIGLVTDIHFGSKQNNKVIFDNQMEFFEKQFFPFLLENSITDVVCCGDVFDNRQVIDVYILQELRERFFGWFGRNGVSFLTLLGNHDIVHKSSLDYNIFKSAGLDLIENIEVYDVPTKIKIGKYSIGMLPWIITDDEAQLGIPEGIDVLFCHAELRDFYVSKGVISKNGFNKDIFKSIKLVCSGHYHIKATQKNVNFLGNPYQKDWGDFQEEKGFWTLGDNFDLHFHQNETSPRHVKINYSELPEGSEFEFEVRTVGLGYEKCCSNIKKMDEIMEVCKNNHVKFIILNGKNQKRIDKLYEAMLQSSNSKQIEIVVAADIIESCDFTSLEDEIKEDSDVVGNMKLYTEATVLKEDLNKDKLLRLFHELHQETLLVERGV
jgi:DNA repair exonuclease SbcCD nuclease subunit